MENVTIIQNAKVKRKNPYGNLALGFRPMPTITSKMLFGFRFIHSMNL